MDQNFRHRPAFGRFGLVRRFGAPGDSSSVPMLSSGRFRCAWRTSDRFPSLTSSPSTGLTFLPSPEGGWFNLFLLLFAIVSRPRMYFFNRSQTNRYQKRNAGWVRLRTGGARLGGALQADSMLISNYSPYFGPAAHPPTAVDKLSMCGWQK